MEAGIESLEITFQIAVLVFCSIVALVRMRSVREKGTLLLLAFYGSFLLGDLYWQVCLLCYSEIPQISLVSDLSWYAAYLFLFLLLRTAAEEKGNEDVIAADPVKMLLPALAPVFTSAMAVFYIRDGKVVSNIVYAALMGLLLFTAVKGLLRTGAGNESFRPLHRTVLLFCLLEYALWTVSCFWDLVAFRYVYFGIDLLITLCFPCLIIAVKREVQP